MIILYSLLFVVIIVGLICIVYVYNYNLLQHSKTKINQAECLIDEALRYRYDIILRADKLVKKATGKNIEKDLDKLKDENISNFDLDRKLMECFNLLKQVKFDNPELMEDKAFKQVFTDDKKALEKLQASKSYYNKYTGEFNDLVRSFPSNIVAKMHGFQVKSFFDGKNMEDTIVDDFKL